MQTPSSHRRPSLQAVHLSALSPAPPRLLRHPHCPEWHLAYLKARARSKTCGCACAYAIVHAPHAARAWASRCGEAVCEVACARGLARRHLRESRAVWVKHACPGSAARKACNRTLGPAARAMEHAATRSNISMPASARASEAPAVVRERAQRRGSTGAIRQWARSGSAGATFCEAARQALGAPRRPRTTGSTTNR